MPELNLKSQHASSPAVSPQPGTGTGKPLSVTDLRKTYSGVTAVDTVSMEIAGGEFVTFLGSSGSGKTTTLMMIAGFCEPDSGSIVVGGRDVTRLAPQKRGLGFVFQQYLLFPHMTVWENVAFPLQLRGVPKAELRRRVGETLEIAGLSAMARRRPRELSGGQQQRVALCRALVYRPPVILMDEPLGALDKKLRDQLQTEIKRIQQELGLTVIYVTHDQEEALVLSDRIAVMRDGLIDQFDTPRELFERPRTPFVADFLGAANFLPGTVQQQTSEQTLVRLDTGGLLNARSQGERREPRYGPRCSRAGSGCVRRATGSVPGPSRRSPMWEPSSASPSARRATPPPASYGWNSRPDRPRSSANRPA